MWWEETGVLKEWLDAIKRNVDVSIKIFVILLDFIKFWKCLLSLSRIILNKNWANLFQYFSPYFLKRKWVNLILSWMGLLGSTISYGIFETNSSFRVEWRAAGKGLIAIFWGFFASFSKIFILEGGLDTGLSFYWV